MPITNGKVAFIRAFKTGAVQAWMDGKPIQFTEDNKNWQPPTNDDLPGFWSSQATWRVKPAEPPQIEWRHLAKEKPKTGQLCVISDGKNFFCDQWNRPTGLPDPPDDWENSPASAFVWWHPSIQ